MAQEAETTLKKKAPVSGADVISQDERVGYFRIAQLRSDLSP